MAVYYGDDQIPHSELPEPENGWQKCQLGKRAKKPAYYYPAPHRGVEYPDIGAGIRNASKDMERVVQYVPEFNGFIQVVQAY